MALLSAGDEGLVDQEEPHITLLWLLELHNIGEMVFFYLETIGDGVALLSTCRTLWHNRSLRCNLRLWKIQSFQLATEDWKDETEMAYRGGTGSMARYCHYAKKDAWKEYGLKFTDYYWTDAESAKYKPQEDAGSLEYGEIFE